MDVPKPTICKIKPRVNPLLSSPRTVAKYGVNKVTVCIQVPNYVGFPDEVRRAAKLLPRFKALQFVYDWNEIPSSIRDAVRTMGPVWRELEKVLTTSEASKIEGEVILDEIDSFFADAKVAKLGGHKEFKESKEKDSRDSKVQKDNKTTKEPFLAAETVEEYARQIIRQARTYGGAPSLTIPVSGQISIKAVNYIRNQNLHHLTEKQIIQIMQAITRIAARGE